MNQIQARKIAEAAALLAATDTEWTVEEYYREYYEQLTHNDYECLRIWLGYMVSERSKVAMEIMKMLISAKLSARRVA